MLADRNGRDDMYRLADDLSFEIDDLLPIVEAAADAGVRQGRGRRRRNHPGGPRVSPKPTSCGRKELFRTAALETCRAHSRRSPARSKPKPNHTLPDEFFDDLLDEHFSEEEAKAQLETAINWGRYAESVRSRFRQRSVLPAGRSAGDRASLRRLALTLRPVSPAPSSGAHLVRAARPGWSSPRCWPRFTACW